MSIVFQELARFKNRILLLFLCMVVSTTASMALPLLMQNLIDQAIPNESYTEVIQVTGLMLIAVFVALFMGIATANISAKVSMGISRNLRTRMFLKVMSFSQDEIEKFSVSSLISRTNNDVQNIQLFLAMSLVIAIMAPVMCIIGAILAIATSPELSIVLLISIPVMVIALILLGKTAQPISVKIQELLDKINMIIREKLTGTRVIRAFGTSKFEEKRFDDVNINFTNNSKKMMRLLGLFMPVITFVLSLTIAGILWRACDSTLFEGINFTVGEVMALVSYVMFIMMSVIMMSVIFLLLPRAATSANRVKNVLESENLIQDSSEPQLNKELHGYLEFKNVSFTYTGSSKPAVKNLSFSAKPGEITAIIGGTGMGKSTIINLIPRLHDVTEGQVLVDGIDVRDYDLEVLRKKIGFVPQKAYLFKGTIDSNIRFGGIDCSEQAVEDAVEIAQSTDFVMSKEKQFQEPVSQGGSNFSGGQRQRLCIARAIVDNPEIYIFDDSFSALDFKTDKSLRNALKAKTQNATTVIVAQRVSTIMDADRIIVIDRGEIVGIDKHENLLRDCEIYKEIYESQINTKEVQNG